MVDSESSLPFPVLMVMGIIVPISPIFIPLGFTVYLYSMRSVKLQAVRGAAGKLGRRVLRRGRRSKELVLPPEGGEGNSHTVSQEVGYTGAFTDVNSTYGSVDKTTYSE